MPGDTVPLPALLLLAFLTYVVGVAMYRLYLSPLAKFPGPKLAALTRWYEAYFEIVQKGRFTFHIEDLHRQYGPIVRITPYEVHIKDPTTWDTLYVKNHKSAKYDWMAGRFGNRNSVLTTADHVLHKVRRQPLNAMFSRKAIVNFEPVVQQKVDILCAGLTKCMERGDSCNITQAASAFAGDIVTNYCFGYDYDLLTKHNLKDSFHDLFFAVSAFGHVSLHFPWVQPLLKKIPASFIAAMNPPLAKLLALRDDLQTKIAAERKNIENNEKLPDFPTIFHTMISNQRVPDVEKTDTRLVEEAQTLLGAGIETTAATLSQTFYYVLSNPSIHAKLKAELREAIPSVTHDAALFHRETFENLPYLRACLKEGVRLSLSIASRNPRVLAEPLVWQDYVIPAGTPISMTIADVHLNDDYFVEASSFKPERWLGESPKAPDGNLLEKYFVAFGKGPRSCIGINLAWMDLLLSAGTIFRKFDMELYETSISDVLIVHDFFLPSPRLDSKGVQIRIKGLES